jgi:folylpolyglutamate synthase
LGLDHTAVLGNTIEEIAKNKAGIYKKGVPALSVHQEFQSGEEVLRRYAEEIGAEFEVVKDIPDVPLGLRGSHQKINAALAVGLAKSYLSKAQNRTFPSQPIIPDSFLPALRDTKWPGRCQSVIRGDVNWLLDGAHTVESLRSCGEWAWNEGWREGMKKRVLIFNCSGGRAGEGLLRALLDAGARVEGGSLEVLGKGFEQVIFCTNVTYTSGEFKGGKCFPLDCSLVSE